MLARHAALGIALAVAGLVAGTATVLAGDEDGREPLHAERRHERQVRSDDVVIDRSQAIRRLERLLEGIDDIAEATRTPWRRGIGPLRLDRSEDGAARPAAEAHGRVETPVRVDDGRRIDVQRERGGERPLGDGDLSFRGGPRGHVPGPSSVESGLYDLRVEVLRLRQLIDEAPVLERAPVIVPMPDHVFRGFLLEVRRARFVDDKVAVIRDVAGRAYFTTEQATEVIRGVSSWGQVDAAFALHDRLVDPQEMFRLYGAITFSSDREALRRRIAGTGRR